MVLQRGEVYGRVDSYYKPNKGIEIVVGSKAEHFIVWIFWHVSWMRPNGQTELGRSFK
jgi:hypothetical protein